MSTVTSLTLFTFKKNKFWAFQQMGTAPIKMKQVRGLQFFKFLGTGGGQGFSLRPDFSTYAFLGVWNNLMDYNQCVENHPVFKNYRKMAATERELLLQPLKSHGLWNGVNPFKNKVIVQPEEANYPAVVITRATLRWNRLISFWRSVPTASKAIEQAAGVRFYKGIGEWPFVQQATISIWENFDAVNDFAYNTKAHAEIVKTTRSKRWYKEDLFSRFYLISDQSKIF